MAVIVHLPGALLICCWFVLGHLQASAAAACGAGAGGAPGDCGGWGGPPCGCSPLFPRYVAAVAGSHRRFPMLEGSFGCWLPEFI